MNIKFYYITLLIICSCVLNVASYASEAVIQIEKVNVSVYDPFPPTNREIDLHEFTLNADELKKFSELAPEFLKHDNGQRDTGVPQFAFTVLYKDGQEISGHFFYGAKKLKVEAGKRGNGVIVVESKLHDYLLSVIRNRGWMKEKP